MRFVKTAVVAGLTIFVSPALAADCDNATDMATLNTCAAEAFREADARLNAHYSEIMKRLTGDEEARKRLRNAQRAWIAFRDAECTFVTTNVEGGSVRPMIESGCRETLTTARGDQLEVYLHCEEGDLSCPVPAP